jgi:hypothetical protein
LPDFFADFFAGRPLELLAAVSVTDTLASVPGHRRAAADC